MTFKHKVQSRYQHQVTAKSLPDMLKKVVTPEWKEDFLSEWDGMPGEKERAEKIDSMLLGFLSLIKKSGEFQGSKIKVFRCLNASLEKIKAMKSVGDHWSFQKDNIACWEQDSKTKKDWYVLEGWMDFSQVDLNETLRANLSFEHETEITLKQGGKVTVERIVSYEGPRLSEKVVEEYKPPRIMKN